MTGRVSLAVAAFFAVKALYQFGRMVFYLFIGTTRIMWDLLNELARCAGEVKREREGVAEAERRRAEQEEFLKSHKERVNASFRRAGDGK